MFTPPPEKKVTRDEALRATETLGLILSVSAEELGDLSVEEVRRAFRARLRNIHPDCPSRDDLPLEETAEAIAAAKRAKETLEKYLAQQPDAQCSTCRGKGAIPGPNRFRPFIPCPTCQ
jgi:DnaJ-class molecular chaperone